MFERDKCQGIQEQPPYPGKAQSTLCDLTIFFISLTVCSVHFYS